MVIDYVAVMAQVRTKARMKAFINMMCPLHPDIRGKMRIGTAPPAIKIPHCIGVKVNNLPGCMNAGVGTAGTNHFYRTICHVRKRCLDAGLNRWPL